jgi:hypothetical protein
MMSKQGTEKTGDAEWASRNLQPDDAEIEGKYSRLVNGEDDANGPRRDDIKIGAARFPCCFFLPQVLMAFSSIEETGKLQL